MTDKLSSRQDLTIQVDNLLLNLFVDATVDIAYSHLVASLHRHSYIEVFVCKSGKVQIKTEDQTYYLLPGDVAIAPPGIMHLRTPNFSSESQWASIGFFCSECVCRSDRDTYTLVSRLMEQEEIVLYHGQGFLYDVICDIKSNSRSYGNLPLLVDFVSILAKMSQTIPLRGIVNNGNGKSKNMDRLLKLDYFINYEFMNPLTNKKIADHLHIGERQLARLVLTHYGTTFHTLLLRKRISVAAKLLIESTDTIENIALAVGFKGKMNFYREFNKAYQMTPGQYRNDASNKPI